ncbi:hypothetical protein [Bacillus mycoides]|uniref:hypothetical protein n=1 Tax=Bacillus mycoides TaxID=1405 RepID=UPI001C009190|nr:hypothetical protein [Bacillus mycoides]
MEDKDVINHRLEALETTVKQMYAEKMVTQGQINALSVTVDGLKNYIGDLEMMVKNK